MAKVTINFKEQANYFFQRANHKKQEEISQRQLGLMKKGFKLGTWKINRDELHERLY